MNQNIIAYALLIVVTSTIYDPTLKCLVRDVVQWTYHWSRRSR